MNDQNLGKHVEWQDDDDGFHTGRVVILPKLCSWPVTFSLAGVEVTLVQESCDYTLTWVPSRWLKDRPMRNEMKPEHAEPTK